MITRSRESQKAQVAMDNAAERLRCGRPEEAVELLVTALYQNSKDRGLDEHLYFQARATIDAAKENTNSILLEALESYAETKNSGKARKALQAWRLSSAA